MELCLQLPLMEIGRVLELNDSHGNMCMDVLSMFKNVGFHELASGESTCCSVCTARHVESCIGCSRSVCHFGALGSICVLLCGRGAPVLHLR